MIYLKESYDLHPASPAQRDRFVEAVEKNALTASAAEGGRLVGGFFAHEEWFSQILHVTAFDDLAAFDTWRRGASSDSALGQSRATLAAFARDRRQELLEPLGPIPPSKLDEAIESAQAKPVGVYSFAILEVEVGAMDTFKKMLSGAAAALPIVAGWGDVAGNPNRVIDLWKGDTVRQGYRPSDDQQNAFFEPLRRLAPRERMMRLHPMPYSPLR